MAPGGGEEHLWARLRHSAANFGVRNKGTFNGSVPRPKPLVPAFLLRGLDGDDWSNGERMGSLPEPVGLDPYLKGQYRYVASPLTACHTRAPTPEERNREESMMSLMRRTWELWFSLTSLLFDALSVNSYYGSATKSNQGKHNGWRKKKP
ncbi:hypothetical protein NM208_g11240 [Fusarium decemcellulare]|uniref:Uncharacterized protein n=1 Tax=Fusarium decemcellulare TaxID=57161 RepID=A0ACC1RV14_9HYPO|nr:hypothetical protein NM208_g11240 [Fusarium decemcellulare]